MRKTSILTATAVLAVLFAGAIFFNSCTKQENAAKEPGQQTQQPEMTQEDVATYNKIMGFKTKVDYIKENPMYKSGEEMSVDSAVWYLDAAVNLTHAFGFEPFSEFYTDSVFIEIPVVGGMVNFDDVSAGYFELVDKIRDDIYAEVQEDDKQLYTSSTTLSSEENGNIILKTTSTIGSKETLDGEIPFTECWKYGEMAGSCEDPNLNSDAIHEIAAATILYKPTYIVDEGEHWHAYYTGPQKEVDIKSYLSYEAITGVDLLLNHNDNEPYNNDRDKLMFYQNLVYGALEEQMEMDKMNFYYNGVHKIIYEIIPSNANYITDWDGVQGLTFNGITLKEGSYTGTPGNKEELYHRLKILYKTRRIVVDGEYPKPIEG